MGGPGVFSFLNFRGVNLAYLSIFQKNYGGFKGHKLKIRRFYYFAYQITDYGAIHFEQRNYRCLRTFYGWLATLLGSVA